MAQSKAAAAGIKIKPAGAKYQPSDTRERRDTIKTFLARPELLKICNDKLFKVLVADNQSGFTADEGRRFVLDFLIPEINADRDDAVKRNKQVKKRPSTIDQEDAYWKNEVEGGLKDIGLKPTKNTRDNLTDYMTNMLGRVQKPCDSAIEGNPKGL